MKRWRLLAISLCLAETTALALLPRGGGATPSLSYRDFCSLTNVSCVYAYSVVHRLSTTNTIPFTLKRTSDGATLNASYTGSSFVLNVSAATTFCLANGGTTTTAALYTTYSDCKITELFDQVDSCNLTAPYVTSQPPFRIWRADGFPAIIGPTSAKGTINTPIPWLTASGCSAVSGAAAKSLITYNNNAFPSRCCAQIGLMEDGVGNPPTWPTTTVPGTMFAQLWWKGGSTPANTALFVPDFEANNGFVGVSPPGTSNRPPIWGVGIITYSGGTNKVNDYFNNVQGDTNFTPLHTVNTQSQMNVGCDGDISSCGPVVFRDAVITSNDVSATAGLPATIYTYLTNIYAGI